MHKRTPPARLPSAGQAWYILSYLGPVRVFRAYPYSPQRAYRALVLAYPATYAQMLVDIRLGGAAWVSIKLYRLFRYGAVLLAHYTFLPLGPRQAYRAVHFCQSEFHLKFLPFVQGGYGACGTRPAAKSAVVFAVAYLRNELRGPDALGARLEHYRMKRVSRADLHAVAASDAAICKIFFFQRCRRPYDSDVPAGIFFAGFCAEKRD